MPFVFSERGKGAGKTQEGFSAARVRAGTGGERRIIRKPLKGKGAGETDAVSPPPIGVSNPNVRARADARGVDV